MRLLVVFLFFVCTSVSAQTTFILVRHAEKETAPANPKDPMLSKEGEQRAQSLAHLLEKQKIDMILSTGFNRTKSTVKPLADAKGIAIQTYESIKEADITKLIRSGGTILICGHSNTIPVLANLLLAKDQFATFEDSDYGNILIITKSDHTSLTHLRY